MRPSHVWALFRKDIFDILRNYQVLALVITPIVLSLIFSGVYRESRSKTILPKLGVVGAENHPLLVRFEGKDFGVKLVFCISRDALETKIIEGELSFGLLLPAMGSDTAVLGDKPTMTLIFPTGLSEFMVERLKGDFEREIRKISGIPEIELPIRIEMSPVGGEARADRAMSSDFFPMLMLMVMGMIGFLGMPLSIVEEKEKRTLFALFLTPLRTGELILGKTSFSMMLVLLTILTMLGLNHQPVDHPLVFWTIIVLGTGFCLMIGLLIAMVAQSQASVNAIGSTLFMFFQLIPNLSQTSELLKTISPMVPSTYIFRGVKKAMFLDLTKVPVTNDLLILGGWALAAYLAVWCFLRFRRSSL